MPLNYKSYDEEDEDLATLARAAGYFPEEKPVEEVANPVPPVTPEEIHQDPYAFAKSVDPAYNPMAVAPVGTTSSPASLPPGTSHSQSTAESQSYHGWNPGKFGQVQQSTDASAAQGMNASDATAAQWGAKEIPVINRAYDSSIDAATTQAKANVNMIMANGEQALVMQRLQDEFAAEETKINAQSTAQANQAKADYMAALNDFRASRVDPSQLWHNMTGGERFGTLASAFVHDFLGARGINTSAMATLNKAIDRNIDAQVQAIRTKGEAAEGFKSLWYMQRNQSASDAEARARVRTFLLDGAKQAVIANMAPYESALASAQGKAAIAKIDEELAKSYVDVYRHIDANSLALRQQALSKWQTQVNAALETQANSVRQQEANTHSRLADKQTQPAIPRGIYDPETKQLVAFYKPGVKDDEMAKTDEALIDAKAVNDDLQALRTLARQIGEDAINPLTGTRFADTAQQNFDATATRLAHHMVKSMGEKATDKDVDQMLKGLRTPGFLNMASAEKVIAFTQERVLNPVKARVSQLGYRPDGQTIVNAPDDILFPGNTSDAHNTHTPPPADPADIRRKSATEDLGSKRSKEALPEDEYTAPVKQLHEQLLKERPDLFQNTTPRKKIGPMGTIEDDGAVTEAKGPMRFEHGLSELADMAEKGDKNAYAQLQSIAGAYMLNHDDPEAAAAAYILTTLKHPGD